MMLIDARHRFNAARRRVEDALIIAHTFGSDRRLDAELAEAQRHLAEAREGVRLASEALFDARVAAP